MSLEPSVCPSGPPDSQPRRTRRAGWAPASLGSAQIGALSTDVRNSRRLVCRERSIVRGDGGRFTTPPPSRLEARSRLGDKAANELGAPVVSCIPAQLPGPEPASARKGREDDRAVLRWNRPPRCWRRSTIDERRRPISVLQPASSLATEKPVPCGSSNTSSQVLRHRGPRVSDLTAEIDK
jgi:hypothetical protein